MRQVLFVLVLLLAVLFPLSGFAQTVDSYQVKYFNAGAAQPLQQSDAFPATAAVCNQAPPTPTNTINPTRLVWSDPANAGRVCIYTAPATSSLQSFPFGSYEGVLVAINATGSSPDSNRAPFSRLAAPSAPTGFSFTR